MDANRILIYEPQVGGHHVGWLRFITEDLLGAGFPLSLALDTRPEAMKRIESQMGDLLPRVQIQSAFPPSGDKTKITSPARVAACLKESGAALAFLANFNDIASTALRLAAIGLMPDQSLRGRLGGIYFRPLFLNSGALSPNQALKRIGFSRLIRNSWLNPILMIDPLPHSIAKGRYANAPIHLLADPYPENFEADRVLARKQFNLPDEKFVFLFYGGGYKRKGLHLATKAMLSMSTPGRAYLLCAGLQPDDKELKKELEMLRSHGHATIINRYVSAEEEKQLFAACDMVLLPYIHHLDGSGVLSRTAGAGKPALASDEYLIGHVVRSYKMGLLFPACDVAALKNAIARAVSASSEELAQWRAGALDYARTCTRAAYRKTLVTSVQAALANQK
jgi:glycosyltransferase involved in cell wall biosynthesis